METKSKQMLIKPNESVEKTPDYLVALALDKQADPATIEKLLNLQERWQKMQAQKEFVAAMTSFKKEAPAVLRKCDVVDFTTQKGRTRYNYANLGSIVQEITYTLSKHDLSVSWSTDQKGTDVTVTCHITHIAGHRESVTLTGPIDESGNKNRIQAVGSTVTYLERYTLLAALGLATGEDDDGRGGVDQEERALDSKPTTTEKPKTRNFDFLKKMAAAKKALGEEAYYEVLYAIGGYEHANEVIESEQEGVINAMREKFKELSGKGQEDA